MHCCNQQVLLVSYFVFVNEIVFVNTEADVSGKRFCAVDEVELWSMLSMAAVVKMFGLRFFRSLNFLFHYLLLYFAYTFVSNTQTQCS